MVMSAEDHGSSYITCARFNCMSGLCLHVDHEHDMYIGVLNIGMIFEYTLLKL